MISMDLLVVIVVLGAALLYFDQAARVGSTRRRKSLAREAVR